MHRMTSAFVGAVALVGVLGGPAQAFGQPGDTAPFRGRVIDKNGLVLRDRPSLKGKKVGIVRFGRTVKIKCQVNSDKAKGNRIWYLVDKDHWTWGASSYIKHVGKSPVWCPLFAGSHLE